jgi:hypothetical protein
MTRRAFINHRIHEDDILNPELPFKYPDNGDRSIDVLVGMVFHDDQPRSYEVIGRVPRARKYVYRVQDIVSGVRFKISRDDLEKWADIPKYLERDVGAL